MAYSRKTWLDRDPSLAPQAGETPAQHEARIAAWEAANPGAYTALDAAGLNDWEGRVEAGINAAGSGGSSATGLAPTPSEGTLFNDTLVPVVADGAGLGVGQAQGANQRYFVMTGNFRQVVGILGSDLLTYTAVGSKIKCSPGIWMPGGGIWTPTTSTSSTTMDQDTSYGQPGATTLTTRLGTFAGSAYRRFIQRWYKLPGVRDVLICELILALDKSSSDGTANSGSAGSGASPYAPNFVLMFEATTWSSTGGIALAYDATLDGIPFINGSANTDGSDYLYHFVRPLSAPSTGYYYEDSASPDANQNFGSGALPAGSTYTTVASKTYRSYISVTPQRVKAAQYIVRFAVGVGTSLADAKRNTMNVPNKGPEDTIAWHQDKMASYPRPANLSASETQSWKYFMYNPLHNARGTSDWHAEKQVWDGVPRRYLYGGLGRWNAVWTFDNSLGLMGMSQIDPSLVKDFLDFLLNNCMNQSTGFLRRDPTVTNETSMGNFFMARLARRYLAATGDSTFVTALYPKLALLYNWWTVTASSAYRHPSWPTVKLLTASNDRESQEVSPVSSNSNYPAGDDWVTAAAYDFCVHMAYLATVTGNSGDAATWTTRATDYRTAINTYCWDATQGWYQPVMTPSSPSGGQSDSLGRFQAVRTYRAFPHLYYGTATPARAETMRAQIMDTNIFLGTYGVRTVDKRWAGYLPNDWVNGGSRPYYDAQISCGFRRYGFNTDADTVLQKWVTRQNTVGTTPEMSNPDTGLGGFARFLFAGQQLVEAILAKRAPTLLGVDSGSTTAIGLDAVTS